MNTHLVLNRKKFASIPTIIKGLKVQCYHQFLFHATVSFLPVMDHHHHCLHSNRPQNQQCHKTSASTLMAFTHPRDPILRLAQGQAAHTVYQRAHHHQRTNRTTTMPTWIIKTGTTTRDPTIHRWTPCQHLLMETELICSQWHTRSPSSGALSCTMSWITGSGRPSTPHRPASWWTASPILPTTPTDSVWVYCQTSTATLL